jgi:hypothetical protein
LFNRGQDDRDIRECGECRFKINEIFAPPCVQCGFEFFASAVGGVGNYCAACFQHNSYLSSDISRTDCKFFFIQLHCMYVC